MVSSGNTARCTTFPQENEEWWDRHLPTSGRQFFGAPPCRAAMHILFVCTGNAARSQIAEGWARYLAPGTTAESAGTRPARLSRRAVAAMAEAGVDISAQRSKPLSATAWRDADIAITLCGSAQEECVALPWSPVTQREHWPIADPVAAPADDEPLAPFRVARDDIRARVEALLATLENK
uniref:Protein tyrosine phosphatase (ARSC2, arsC) n=1 Tax=uncultured marine group II/III euryarchaeote KM3_76_H07 TaxID=1456507 RepID=A0A075HPN5_9EURY|nr:protein tyrosine phosphatase (ARSC2, arsC) [uncultured marine group II/III euryarchaeote KM3_76_H07]